MVARASHFHVKSPFSLLLLAAATLPSAATKIVALSAVAPKIDANNLPGEIQVLKWGDNQTTQGIVRVGKKTLACLAANQAATGFEEVCLDFAHNTVEGSPTYKGEPAQVAATHCKPEVREGDGLFLMSVNWTDEGKKFASHYPDVSGAVGLDETGEVIFMHSAGLCRQGCARDIKLFSTSLPVLTGLKKPSKAPTPPVRTLATNSVDLDALRTLLRLSADATPQDINDAVATAIADGSNDDEDDVDDSTPHGKKLKALSVQIQAISSVFMDGERQRILTEAREAGREIPAEWLPDANGQGGLPISQLRTLAATLPETVPLAARTPAKINGATVVVKTLSAEQKKICAGLGIKEEDFLKTV